MEVWSGRYEKPELVSVAEQIHKLKSQKADLELELSEQKFKYRYIPQRKELAGKQFRNLFIAIFLVGFIILGFFVFSFSMIFADADSPLAGMIHSEIGGMAFMLACFVMSYGGYLEIIMLKQAVPLFKLLSKKKIDKRDIKNTIDEDNYKTRNAINLLEEEIEGLSKEISELQQRQKALIEEKEQREKVLREKGVLFDEKPDKKEGGIALKDNGQLEAAEIAMLYDYYQKEEYYILDYMHQLESSLEHINRDLVRIDEEFEHVKAKILISAVCFILLAFIQSQFTGAMLTLTSLLCFFFSLVYVFYLDKVCMRPILDYLIEHDSVITREYAFRTDAVPVAEKRKEVMEQLKHYKKELDDIKKQREMLDFS